MTTLHKPKGQLENSFPKVDLHWALERQQHFTAASYG